MKRTLVKISKVYLYLLGAFFILMAVDCFSELGCPNCNSIWEQLLCFGMSIIPGVIVILLSYFLRKKEKILGFILGLLAIFAFFFFKMYREFLEKIPVFITIVIIPLLMSFLFVFKINDEKLEK